MSQPTSSIAVRGRSALGDGQQEPSVATGRVEHPHRPAHGGRRGRRADRRPRSRPTRAGCTTRPASCGSVASGPPPENRLHVVPDRYLTFERDDWAALARRDAADARPTPTSSRCRASTTASTSTRSPPSTCRSAGLLNLYVSAVQDLQRVSSTFLGSIAPKVPYVIGVAGSVAVGKSTFARILQALLSRWPNHPQVDLVTTDGFLHPNAVLDERDLMDRKGFPESYDTRALLRVPASGQERSGGGVGARVRPCRLRRAPGSVGDGAASRHRDRRGPQRAAGQSRGRRVRQRLLRLLDLRRRRRERHRGVVRAALLRPARVGVPETPTATSRTSPSSPTSRPTRPPVTSGRRINGRNLRENIAPTRERASLIIRKATRPPGQRSARCANSDGVRSVRGRAGTVEVGVDVE